MKKKKVDLNKRLLLNKETINHLNSKIQQAIIGGATGTCEPPVSGTGCGCDMKTCGIILC
jgi:hypothetical protein